MHFRFVSISLTVQFNLFVLKHDQAQFNPLLPTNNPPPS